MFVPRLLDPTPWESEHFCPNDEAGGVQRDGGYQHHPPFLGQAPSSFSTMRDEPQEHPEQSQMNRDLDRDLIAKGLLVAKGYGADPARHQEVDEAHLDQKVDHPDDTMAVPESRFFGSDTMKPILGPRRYVVKLSAESPAPRLFDLAPERPAG